MKFILDNFNYQTNIRITITLKCIKSKHLSISAKDNKRTLQDLALVYGTWLWQKRKKVHFIHFEATCKCYPKKCIIFSIWIICSFPQGFFLWVESCYCVQRHVAREVIKVGHAKKDCHFANEPRNIEHDYHGITWDLSD